MQFVVAVDVAYRSSPKNASNTSKMLQIAFRADVRGRRVDLPAAPFFGRLVVLAVRIKQI